MQPVLFFSLFQNTPTFLIPSHSKLLVLLRNLKLKFCFTNVRGFREEEKEYFFFVLVQFLGEE